MDMKKTFLSVNINDTLVEQIKDAKLYFDVDFSRNNIQSQWLSRTVTAKDTKIYTEVIKSVAGGPAYSYNPSLPKSPVKISRPITPDRKGESKKVVVTQHSSDLCSTN